MDVPFERVAHLKDRWNNDRPLAEADDGKELPSEVGEGLRALLEAAVKAKAEPSASGASNSAAQPSSSTSVATSQRAESKDTKEPAEARDTKDDGEDDDKDESPKKEGRCVPRVTTHVMCVTTHGI